MHLCLMDGVCVLFFVWASLAAVLGGLVKRKGVLFGFSQSLGRKLVVGSVLKGIGWIMSSFV